MEEYFLYFINNFSLEIFLMSFLIFVATMLIKIPIKKATSKLEEAKRQCINSFIILIPLVLAFVFCVLYFLIIDKPILSLAYVSCSLSTCITSISIYLIYSRVKIIIKGILSGKTKLTSNNIQNAVSDITNAIENKQNADKADGDTSTNIDELKEKINLLLEFKQKLENESKVQNITTTENNTEINLPKEQTQQYIN